MFTCYWKVLLPLTLSDPLDHPIQCAQLLTGLFQGEQKPLLPLTLSRMYKPSHVQASTYISLQNLPSRLVASYTRKCTVDTILQSYSFTHNTGDYTWGTYLLLNTQWSVSCHPVWTDYTLRHAMYCPINKKHNLVQ